MRFGDKLGAPGKPTPIRGVVYPSQTAAAKAMGVTTATISIAKRRGRLDFVGTGTGNCRSQPTEVFGHRFPSQSALAQAIGCHWSEVGRALDRGTLEALVRRRAPHLERAE